MEDFNLSYLYSQVNSSLVSNFSSFLNDICKGDYTSKFTSDKIFPTIDFVVIILRSDKYNGQPGRKAYVFLGCERGRKYKKYKSDAELSLPDTRKCDYQFKLRGKPISKGEGWVLKVICGYHNHDLSDTLVGHPFAGR